jgi:hypothetical protein
MTDTARARAMEPICSCACHKHFISKCPDCGCKHEAVEPEQDGWISVEERLPEMTAPYENGPLESDRVLVTNGTVVDLSRYSETYKKRIARWTNKWLDWTHWRPLPAPPKKGRSDD